MLRSIAYYKFKCWEKLYDLSYLIFGNLPVTEDIKHKMYLSYMKYRLHERKSG